ncbi:DUF3895 domain-containing protein [Bacillus niameyensis]|uniref:DUF3895 domain-containing protein n=1 Tax=Bacillus niameyensis TaxID=1522308 RepID=UPI0007846FB3|nr:DUF3895 domain-containing protein [Bacillus niameyensis]
MNVVLNTNERESLLSLLTEQQKSFLQDHVKRGKKTVFANQMAKDKGLVLPEGATSEEIEMLLDEWILVDYIDNGFINPETPCECGKPLRYQYIVRHKTMNEVRRFGSTHFEEHTGLPAQIVNQIKKGFTQIDYEMDELLQKFADGWVFSDNILPKNFTVPDDIKEHLDLELPLLDRQITRLKKLINEFLSEQEVQRPIIEKSTRETTFDSYEDPFALEMYDLFQDSIGETPAEKPLTSHLTPIIKDEILRYLDTVSSARIICELLIKNHSVLTERYVTGKPKIYPKVCMYLDLLVSKEVVRLEDKRGHQDRLYKKVK